MYAPPQLPVTLIMFNNKLIWRLLLRLCRPVFSLLTVGTGRISVRVRAHMSQPPTIIGNPIINLDNTSRINFFLWVCMLLNVSLFTPYWQIYVIWILSVYSEIMRNTKKTLDSQGGKKWMDIYLTKFCNTIDEETMALFMSNFAFSFWNLLIQ